MKKVYIVSAGSFDDYTILGVFDTEKAAKEFIENSNKDNWPGIPNIEEHILNPDNT